MTNRNQLTGVEMALIAQSSGAAAVVVVNVDGGEDRPEDMYRLPLEPGHERVTIPTLMISLNSANSLTTATVAAGMRPSDIVNHGMPDRVRLYGTEQTNGGRCCSPEAAAEAGALTRPLTGSAPCLLFGSRSVLLWALL
jgi:hypothetical protein